MPYLPLLRKTPPGCGPSKRSSCRSRILISSPAEKIPLWSESKTHFLPKMGRKTEVDESTSHPQSYAGSTCLLFEGWTSPRKNCFHLEPIWPPSVHWQVAAIPRAGGLAPISWLVTSAFTKTLGLVEGLHGPCFEGKMGKHKICERTEGGFMVVSFLMNP